MSSFLLLRVAFSMALFPDLGFLLCAVAIIQPFLPQQLPYVHADYYYYPKFLREETGTMGTHPERVV